MSLIGKLTGRDSEPEEYSPTVQAVRDAKQAELDHYSTKNKIKQFFKSKTPKDGVDEIASFEEPPELESSEPESTITSRVKAGILNKGKKIREYWDSIGDAPVAKPMYVAVEPEVVHDEETRDKANKALSKSSKQKASIIKKARKAYLKQIEQNEFDKAKAERKANDAAEAERKAIERGRYVGSTTVTERSIDRAKRVGRGGKRVAGAIQSVANELGNTRLGYETKQGVKQAQRKINSRFTYESPSTKARTRTFAPARQISGSTRRKETLAVSKASPVSTSSLKGSPASSKNRGSPSSRFKDAPVSSRAKHGSLVNKIGFTGFGKVNRQRPSFL